VTATEPGSNPYPRIKAYERRELERLDAYLRALDADGWTEQSYCSEWLVYQVVSHIGSGSRIGGMRLKAWVGGGQPVARETMQQVWGYFDSLGPEQMYQAFADGMREYLEAEANTPDAAGLQEVDGFAGKRPLYAYQISRTWELACHSWDVYVARHRGARLHPDAVSLLAANLQYVTPPIDKERGASLATKPIVFELTDSGARYTLDPAAERPRLTRGGGDAPMVVSGPDEEVVRFVAGRHFLPGAPNGLRSTQDLADLRRAFR
jgi:uncharacterized protein (TIGR03083 family)